MKEELKKKVQAVRYSIVVRRIIALLGIYLIQNKPRPEPGEPMSKEVFFKFLKEAFDKVLKQIEGMYWPGDGI